MLSPQSLLLFLGGSMLVQSKYNNIIDVDDILAADYMPGSLLMLENPESSVKNLTISERSLEALSLRNDSFGNEANFDGKFNKAFSTMVFHRNKMNEYFCRNYIAEQIIEGLSLTRLRRRSDTNRRKFGVNVTSNHKDHSMLDDLIEDEGSSNYKSWLAKSTTLEDIYRHYQDVETKNDQPDPISAESSDYDAKNDKHDNLFDQNNKPQVLTGPAKVGYGEMMGYGMSGHGGSSGYSYGGSGYGGPPLVQHHQPYGSSGHGHAPEPIHIVHETVTHHEHVSGGKDLSELFEIALTALAYLSFGLFVVHVIVCIAQGKQKDKFHMTVMPVTQAPTPGTSGTAMSGGGMNAGGGMNDGGNNMDEGNADGGNADGGNSDEGNADEGNADEGNADEGAGGDAEAGGDAGGADGGEGNPDEAADEGMMEEGVMEEGMMEEGMMDGGGEEEAQPGEGGDAGEGDPDATGAGVDDDTRLLFYSPINAHHPHFNIYDRMDSGVTIPTLRRRRRRRKKRKSFEGREIPTITNPSTEELNELARHILTSIEAALVAHQDKGSCLRKVLCQNNKYARTLENSNKIWIPVWSLGMSWLSGKLTKNVPTATSMLDSLKASILGLGKANCDVIYQDCDLQRERNLRRRRRRRKRK